MRKLIFFFAGIVKPVVRREHVDTSVRESTNQGIFKFFIKATQDIFRAQLLKIFFYKFTRFKS